MADRQPAGNRLGFLADGLQIDGVKSVEQLHAAIQKFRSVVQKLRNGPQRFRIKLSCIAAGFDNQAKHQSEVTGAVSAADTAQGRRRKALMCTTRRSIEL